VDDGGGEQVEVTKRRQVEAFLGQLGADQLDRLSTLGPRAAAQEVTGTLNGQGMAVCRSAMSSRSWTTGPPPGGGVGSVAGAADPEHLTRREQLMPHRDPLGPSVHCPRTGCCEACGTTRDLDVATYQTPVGVICATVCGRCLAAGTAPPVHSWGHAVWRVGAHCQHLGIDLEQMGAIPHAEQEATR
jgi:hypothetical protein